MKSNEMIEQTSKVENTAKKALDIDLQNANDFEKMDEKHDRMLEELLITLKAEIKEKLETLKLHAQMKEKFLEPEDLRNRTMRYTLILKNIPGIKN